MKHIKYYCEYSYFDGRDALDESSKVIKAPSEREAYEIFIKDIGVHQSAVLVSWGLTGHETFYDHMSVEAASDDNESDVSNKLNMNSEQLLQKLTTGLIQFMSQEMTLVLL